jgi:ribosomal protein S18 acetylase RimI-like enzyme
MDSICALRSDRGAVVLGQTVCGNTEVRQAGIRDTAVIRSILLRSFREFRSYYTPVGFAATVPRRRQIAARLHEGPIWIALQRERPVGTISVVEYCEELYIRGLAVAPEARGQGIGRLLLGVGENYAREGGLRSLRLRTASFLTAAVRTYERLGYQRLGHGLDDYHGVPVFTMVKPIMDPELRSSADPS